MATGGGSATKRPCKDWAACGRGRALAPLRGACLVHGERCLLGLLAVAQVEFERLAQRDDACHVTRTNELLDLRQGRGRHACHERCRLVGPRALSEGSLR